jgi:hypothetical protein
MDTFKIWFVKGFHHIVGIDAQDHILFLVALCACYFLADWKKVLLLATAFTIGHSITLVLVTFKLLQVNANLVENWLIPISILITAILNLSWRKQLKTLMWQKYLVAITFGLVHGAAFSTQLSQLLSNNSKEWFQQEVTPSSGIGLPLFAFNVGIEVGQILIISILLFLAAIFTKLFRTQPFTWTTFLSGIAFGVALSILLERNLAQ